MLSVPNEIWFVLVCASMGCILLGLKPRAGSGERRCPECWYDMSRVVGAKCPECNHSRRSAEDFYPTRLSWVLVALGAMLGTPAMVTLYEATFEDPDGRAMLIDLWGCFRVVGLGMMIFGIWLTVRTCRRWARARRHGRASPHEWKALAVIALLLTFHGLCVYMLPPAAVQRWSVVPESIRDLLWQVVHQPRK